MAEEVSNLILMELSKWAETIGCFNISFSCMGLLYRSLVLLVNDDQHSKQNDNNKNIWWWWWCRRTSRRRRNKRKINAVTKPMYLSDYSYWHRYCKIIENRFNRKMSRFFSSHLSFVVSFTNFSARNEKQKLDQCNRKIRHKRYIYIKQKKIPLICTEIDTKTWICYHFLFRG